LNWPVHIDGDVPVTGYVLEIDLDHFGIFEELLDVRDEPDTRTYLLTEVVTGTQYDFRYKVIDLNGIEVYSDILQVWACENPS
jgi:hypothetical protein